jgi:hypothetical protein
MSLDRAFNRRQEYREDHGEYPPNDWLKKEKTMSHPDPRENFEDKPGDFPIIRTEIDGVTGTTRLKLTYQGWLDDLPTPIQQKLGQLIWRLHEYADNLSISQQIAVIDSISAPYDGALDRLSRRLKAEEAAFLEEERRDDPDGTEDGHDDGPDGEPYIREGEDYGAA